MEYVKVLLPSICVGLLFWYVLRAIVRADRIERDEMDRHYARMEKAGTDDPQTPERRDSEKDPVGGEDPAGRAPGTELENDNGS